ncbi:MAG: ATP-binding cassette domain-containing protein [Crocinitomicaceae bacterium]|nr:ATP-binding cassette domain-containing protein [Crocinitomicaceae bacterium]
MLRLSKVGLKREDWIFRDISFEIGQGELVGVVGRSGVGKTSLLKLMCGLLDSSEGEIFFEGGKLQGPSIKLIPGYEELQLVNQDFALDLFHSVEENLREKVLHLHKEDQHVLINELLELLELNQIKNRKAHLLSGGEQQRLALGRAIACEPKFLLLDEPFVHLDLRLRLRIIGYLLELNNVRNTTVILVSHDGEEIMSIANKIIYLEGNGVEECIDPKRFFYSSKTKEKAELLGVVNRVTIGGDEVLFRPNEYDPEGDEIQINYLRSINVGLYIVNYFNISGNSEEVMLVSDEPLEKLSSISIKRKYE